MPTVTQRAPRPRVILKLTAVEVRDMLLSLADDERMFVTSDPKPGQHKVISVRRNASGNLEYDYEQ